MDSSISLKDKIWCLRVCHHISTGLYLCKVMLCGCYKHLCHFCLLMMWSRARFSDGGTGVVLSVTFTISGIDAWRLVHVRVEAALFLVSFSSSRFVIRLDVGLAELSIVWFWQTFSHRAVRGGNGGVTPRILYFISTYSDASLQCVDILLGGKCPYNDVFSGRFLKIIVIRRIVMALLKC